MKIIKRVLIGIMGCVIMVLALSAAHNLYINLTTSDEAVAGRCDMALSKNLMCWCYSEYGRSCPLETAGK